MAKQNKSTDPSEAALSAIEHALSLYGTEKAATGEQGETPEKAGDTPVEEGLRLPRVEDQPLIPTSLVNEESAGASASLEDEMSGLIKTMGASSADLAAKPQDEPEMQADDADRAQAQDSSALPLPEETTLGIIPIKLPTDRQKQSKAAPIPSGDGMRAEFGDVASKKEGSSRAADAPSSSTAYSSMKPERRPQLPDMPPALDRPSMEGADTRRASVLPANDDTRASVAEMLEPLTRKASNTPVLIAGLLSATWLIGMVILLSQTGGLLFGENGALRANATGASVLALLGTIGPILFFFSMAALSQRSREMRVSAKVMAEVAARLAEPEVTASESVFTLGQAVRREVASIGDGIERALSRAGDLENLVHGEVAALERSYSENEYKMRSLVGELSAEREAIMATAERIRLTIDAAHQGFAADITKASSSISEAIDEAGDRVTFLIGGKQDEIVATLDRNASHAAELIGLRTNELAEKLGAATTQAEQMLAVRTQDLAEKITHASNQTVDAFSRVGEDVVSLLARTGSTITGDIENLTVTASSKLEDQSTRMIEDIGAAGDALAARINLTNKDIVQEWDSLSSSVTAAITQASTGATELFRTSSQEATEAISTSLSRSTETLGTVSETLKQEFETAIDRLNTTFDEKSQTIISNIGAKAIEINEVVQNAGADLFTRLEERGRSVAEIIDTKAGSLVESVSQRAEALATRFHSDAERLENVFSASSQQVESSIAQGTSRFSNLFEAHNEAIATNLDQASRQVGETLSRERMALETQLGKGSEALASTLSEQIAQANESFTVAGETIAKTLSERIAQANESFSIAGESLGSLIAENTQEASKGLKLHIDDLGLTLMQQSAQVTQQMVTSGREITDSIIAQGNRVNEALGHNAGQLSNAIQLSAQELNAQFTQFETGFVEKAKALEYNVLQHGESLGIKLAEQSSTVSTTLTSLLDRIETGLDERAKSLGDVLALRTLELSRLIGESSGRLEAVTTQSRETAAEAIERAEELARSITNKVSEINTLFDENGTRFIKGLEGHGRELLLGLEGNVGAITTRLTVSMAELNEAVASGSTASLSQLSEANDLLRNEVTILLGRLGDANSLLGSIVGTTTERLTDVEGRMTDRVDRLEKALAGILSAADEGSAAVLERVEALKSSSGDLLGSGTSLTSMLAERTEALQTLANQLNATQQNVGDRLLERQTAFESLANTLSSRIEDVDSMLRSFASLVTEQLTMAQQQARETSSLVLEASENATSTISAQYERVRQEAGKERERTATALRQTYEQANGEMSTLLKRALEDFSATAGQVREVSADIIRDIETTRRALEAGGMDIPAQAKQATTNLKRVVQDQLRAVSELGDIVTRSGVALDVAEPRRDEPANRSQPRKPVPFSGEAAPFLPEPPRPQLYAQPEPQPAPPRFDARNAPQQSRNEPPRGNGGSWLSGMLERASEEERAPIPPMRNMPRAPEAPSSNRMEALDNLSVDIARMIDHEMAVDLWERYRRGERNVFTRRLYTLQGQDTYDEIRRRYRRDIEFRQTVDAYILQFERLLGEVAGDDRDSSISRAYLTSETGKVYTMLAHAAGRFD